MHQLLVTAAAVLAALSPWMVAVAPPAPEAIVLGIAQDGGVPHLGCSRPLCARARRDPGRRRLVASLGLVDRGAGKRFVIDATPDFPEQVERLGGMPDAILLTHAHIGHYLGLAQLGREVLGARRVPVFCTRSMAAFLRANAPWSRLVERENIAIREIVPGTEFALTKDLRVTAIRVPHRDEDSDTVAYLVAGPHRRLLWLPDIDRWDRWDRTPEEFASDPRLLFFLDGTFFAGSEVPGRSIEEIPHPLVTETVARLSKVGPRARVFFVHLNHTNPLLDGATAVRDLESRGFFLAREGSRHPL